jgi:hypothetical protein
MRAMAIAVLAVLAMGPALAGTKIDDPVKFVTGVYAHWSTQHPEPEGVFTERLSALQALDEKEAHGDVGRGNDFSFWCNCQDGEMKNAVVKGWPVENASGRQVVEAKFLLDGKKQDILFYFERTKAGWKIDDVQSLGPNGWTLSVVYKYGWTDGR